MDIYLKGNKELLFYHPRRKEGVIADVPTFETEMKTQFTPSDYNYASIYGLHLLEEGLTLSDDDLKLRNQIVELLELDTDKKTNDGKKI